MVSQKNKRTNNRTMLPTLKNNAAAGYQGPVKIELLKGTGLLETEACKLSVPALNLPYGTSVVFTH